MTLTYFAVFRSALAITVAVAMSACAGAGSALRPVSSAPKAVRLPSAVIIGIGPGYQEKIYLPAGVYNAVGENERGVFYSAPGGVGYGIHLSGTTGTVHTLPTSAVPLLLPGGVCVHPTSASDTSVTSYALWRSNLWGDHNKPNSMAIADTPVRFISIQ